MLTRVIPGDPIASLISPQASAETRQALIHEYGLDQPLIVQYFAYLGDLLHGDLGTSFTTSHSVLDDLVSRFGATFELTLYAMIVALVTGIPLGILAAVRRGGGVDPVARGGAPSGSAPPAFWARPVVLFLF